jgi:CubicO group peptidase (beta-lactamase class C family)
LSPWLQLYTRLALKSSSTMGLLTLVLLASWGAPASARGACPQFFDTDASLTPEDFVHVMRNVTTTIDAALAASDGGGVQGLSLQVVYDQDTIYSHNWGTEDGAAPVTSSSRFLVASVTKLATALAVLANSKTPHAPTTPEPVDLDAPLSQYVPACPPCSQMTFRQLLSHRAGLPTDPSCGLLTQNCVTTTAEQVADMLAAGVPLYPPGGNVQYSDLGYALAGQALAAHLGYLGDEGFAVMMNDTVLAPLAMEDSSFDPSAINALAYFPQGKGPINSGNWGWVNPAGGMVSSSADLAKLVKLLLRFDRAGGPGLGGLDGAILWDMFTTKTNAGGPAGEDFSLGMEINSSSRPEGVVASKVGSQGFFFPTSPGFVAIGWTAFVSVMPNLRLGVAITASANGKRDAASTFTASDANDVVLDQVAPFLADLLAASFPSIAPVPAGVDVSPLVGTYNVSMHVPSPPPSPPAPQHVFLFQATVSFDEAKRIVSMVSPLGSYQVGFLRQNGSLTAFRLPVNEGCQDGTLQFAINRDVVIENGHTSVELTVPYTYAGMKGIKVNEDEGGQ